MATFTDEDVRRLELSMQLREELLLKLKAEDRKDVGYVNSFTNLAESLDRSILSKAKIKVEEEANKTSAANKEAILEFMMAVHSNASAPITSKVEREIPKYIPTGEEQVIDGELITKEDKIDVKAYLANLDND